jgi:hypothetical protein
LNRDLRRTAAEILVWAGVRERVATTLTGHRTRVIFDGYVIVSEKDLVDAVPKLAQRRSGA